MSDLDHQLFFAINNGWKFGLNDLWLGYATWLGNGWITFPLAILLLVLLDRQHWKTNLLALVAAGIVGGVALNFLKVAVHSPRPLDFFRPDILAGRAYINVMFEPLYANSFPSGHTQTAFTVATVLAWASARARKLNFWSGAAIFAGAVIVGLSRIYCGAHFPSDVVGGAVLGGATAFGCCYAIGRMRGERPS